MLAYPRGGASVLKMDTTRKDKFQCEVQSGSLIMNTLGTKKSVHNRDTSY